MTGIVPFGHPNIPSPGQPVKQAGGVAQALSGGIAAVLAAMQQKRENDFRQRQLDQTQYYYSVQSREQDLAAAEAERQRIAAGQIGGALQRVIGGFPSATPPQFGNQLQAGPGLRASMPGSRSQAGLGIMPGEWDQYGRPNVPLRNPLGLRMPSSTTDPANDPEMQGVFQELFTGAASALNPAGLDPYMQAAFRGVQPENLADAVKAAQEVQALAPAQPDALKPTTDIQNYLTWTQLNGVDPRDPRAVAFFKSMIGPKAGTTVVVGAGEKAFDKTWNESLARALTDVEDVARKSANAATGMIEAYGLVGRSYTGFAANQKLYLSRMALALGAPAEAVKTANTQVLQKLAGDQVLALMGTRVLGSNNAISDSDLRFANQQSGRDITQDPIALKKTIRINMGTGMVLQQDAVNGLREQAQYASPPTAKQLLGKADAIEARLGGLWLRYAVMLQDEGESLEELEDRLSPRIRERYGAQIRKMYGQRQRGLRSEASKIPGVNLPGQR